MKHLCLLPLLVLLLSMGCSTASRPSPFDAALQFVPEGMESVLLHNGVALFESGTGSPDRYCVFAARDFRMRGPGTGDYVGLTVQDFGDGPVPDTWRETIVNGMKWIKLEGHDVLFVPGLGDGVLEHWKTVVDDRFLIDASRRVVLQQALHRSGGTVADFAKTIGFPAPVEQREGMTLLRQWKGDWGRNEWSARIRAHVDKKRIDLRVRTNRPDEFRDGLERLFWSAGATPGNVRWLESTDDEVLHIVLTFPVEDSFGFTSAHSVSWLIGFMFYI